MQTAGNDSANIEPCAAPPEDSGQDFSGRPIWRRELAAAIREPDRLLEHLGLDARLLDGAIRADQSFPLLVPPHYLSLIEPGNPADPLLLQVLPQLAECLPQPAHFVPDPLQENRCSKDQTLLQKYHGRSLLITTGACAIHCRYCFRRHFPYAEAETATDWSAQLDAWRADPELREVILSGGDPLMLSDRRLAALFDALAALPSLQRIRIHSRIPLVLPSRVNDVLLQRLRCSTHQVVLVIHANHPREVDPVASRMLRKLRDAGVTLLNQSVLLRDINDDPVTLAQLSERLFAAGVLPYYLHQLDPVLGAAHFEVPDPEALALHRQLSDRLPGYLVPRLVRELPGEAAKRPVTVSPRTIATDSAERR